MLWHGPRLKQLHNPRLDGEVSRNSRTGVGHLTGRPDAGVIGWRRWALGITAVVGLLLSCLLVSCAKGLDTPARNGHVVGCVFVRSGINPTPSPVGVNTRVLATPTGGRASQVWATEAGRDGCFAFDLPPGTYELTATADTQNPGGDQATPEDVTVRVGIEIRADLYINYP